MELSIEQALQQAVAAHKKGKIHDAERLYRAILQSQPAHADANHNLGVLESSGNKTDVALPLFKTALQANPRIGQFWLSYIEALIRDKQFEKAKQVYEQAKQQGVAAEWLNSIKIQLSPETPIENTRGASPSQEQLNNLLDYYQNGRFSEAEKLGEEITYEFPKHQFAWKVLGAVLGATGRKSEAAVANQTAVTLSPQDAEAHSNLGVTFQELGRLDESEASLRQAIALKPDYALAHNNLSNTLQGLGRSEEAEASLRQTIALEPEYAEAHSNLGNTLQELGRLAEAEESYKQAIALNADFAEAHSNLGNTLRELGRLDESELSLRQAVALKPDSAEAHNNLGVTLKELGRLDEAEARFTDATTLKPDFAKAHDHLGDLLQSLGKFDQAEVCYQTYITLSPSEEPITESMASKFFAQGKFQKALNLFDSYSTPEARSHALECLHALGDTKEIYKRIQDTADLDDGNLRVAAFASFIAEFQQKETAHRFCKKPLEFIHSSNLSAKLDGSDSFITNLIEDLSTIRQKWQPPNQSATGGFQTVGNLFRYSNSNIVILKEIILNEIDAYYEKFKNERCSLIEKWPAEKNISGWHMMLKEQGYHDLHIHQGGWLSGVIYLKVVPALNKNEGAITFTLAPSNTSYPNFPKIIHNPEVGDMLLFPSSLYHGTIPFSTDTDRIVVSFDLKPGKSA